MSTIREKGNITAEDLQLENEEDVKEIQKKVDKLSAYSELRKIVAKLRQDVKGKNPSDALALTRKAQSDLEKFAMKKTHDNAFATMVLSKAKGSESDVRKITTVVGQFLGPGGIIPPPIKSAPGKFGNELEENAFCEKGMSQGLDVSAFIEYVASVRDSILKTYIATPQIGYIIKRVKELISDVVIADKSVIRFGRRIIMIKFGDFGFHPNRLMNVRGNSIPVDPLIILQKFQDQ